MIVLLLVAGMLQPDLSLATNLDEHGTVTVWQPGGGWRRVYACGPGMERGRLAWVGEILFIACPDQPLARWQPGDFAAHPVANRALARRRPTRLAGGSALFLAEGAGVWRYRPDHDLLEWLGRCPESPIRRLVQGRLGLIAGGAHLWMWRGGEFVPYPPTEGR